MNKDLYHIIETERLVLMPWDIEDSVEMQRILNDESISKNLDTPYPYTLKMAEDFIKNIENREPGYYEWKIVLKENNKIIGGTALNLGSNPINLTHIYIDKDYRNKGYGTEVWKGKIKFCFDKTDSDELRCAFYDGNIESRRMQEKAGMFIEDSIDYNNQITTSIRRR